MFRSFWRIKSWAFAFMLSILPTTANLVNLAYRLRGGVGKQRLPTQNASSLRHGCAVPPLTPTLPPVRRACQRQTDDYAQAA